MLGWLRNARALAGVATVAAATAFGVAVATGAAVGARAATPFAQITAPITIASGKGSAWLSAVADPARNRVYATWGISFANKPDLNSYVAASSDGGRTFGRPVRLPDASSWQSVVRVDAHGRLWASWTHFDMNPKHLLNPKDKYSNPAWQRLAHSDDLGRTWSRPVDLPMAGGKVATAFGSLAVTPDGRTVTAFWLDYLPSYDGKHHPSPGRQAATYLAATSHDGGRTFGTPVQLVRTGCVCCEPFGFVVNGRTALIFRGWQKGTAKGDIRDIKVVEAIDGTRFSAPATVHADHFLLNECPSVGPTAAIDAAGTAHIMWWTGAGKRAGYWYETRDAHGVFGQPVEVEAHPSAPNENNATLAIDASGTTWAATVGHGEYAPKGLDTSPNHVELYEIPRGGTPAAVPSAHVSGSQPSLVAVHGGLVEVWLANDEIVARRLVQP